MQVRLNLSMTIDEYILLEVWETVTISHCPIHPDQDCRIRRHGSYPRKYPKQMGVARYFCYTGEITFSLLPDFLCSRVAGTLEEVEAVVSMIENTADIESSDETGLDSMSVTDLALNGKVEKTEMDVNLYDSIVNDSRWAYRRLNWVFNILTMMIALFPELFGDCRPTLASFRSVLGDGSILVKLRILAGEKVHELALPVGLNPHPARLHEVVLEPPQVVVHSPLE